MPGVDNTLPLILCSAGNRALALLNGQMCLPGGYCLAASVLQARRTAVQLLQSNSLPADIRLTIELLQYQAHFGRIRVYVQQNDQALVHALITNALQQEQRAITSIVGHCNRMQRDKARDRTHCCTVPALRHQIATADACCTH